MNILITGNSGFLGVNFETYVRKCGHKTIGITRSKRNSDDINYKELNSNILDKAIAFIHLAGKAHDLKNVSNENDYFKANTDLTKTVFNQFLESRCRIFIFISSVKAVADTVENVLTEDEIPNPQTAYGRSKLAAEEFILDKLKKWRDTSTSCLPDRLALSATSSKKVYILRPCMIHGSGNKGNLNLLYQLVKKGIPYPLGAFQNKRSFVSINNLNFIIEKLIKLQPESGIYDIADDESISTIELVNLMAETLQRRSRILNIPPKLIKILARVGSFFKLPFNEEKLQKLTENYIVSNQKIKTALQINKLPISATEGLRKTLKSFQTQTS